MDEGPVSGQMSGGKVRYLPISCRACLPITDTVDGLLVGKRRRSERVGWLSNGGIETDRGGRYRDWG